MKKVLLINSNNERMPYPVPPLGLCLLASELEKKYKTEIFDGLFEDFNKLNKKIKSFKPDYIGISIRNIDNIEIDNSIYYIDHILNHYILKIRQETDAPLILGGSGFSIYPNELMTISNADYGIVGEGEDLLPRLLDALDNGMTDINIPGILTKSNGKFVIPDSHYDIKTLPFSEIDKRIDFKPYRVRGAYSIQTKRGCYHNCIYCSYPIIEGTTYRLRDPKSIADEIEAVHKRLGLVTFEFVDSTFNDPPGHAERICEEIIKKNINITLRTMGINPAHATEELFTLMLKAGFKQIDCTPDTASEKMLDNFQKNFTLDQLENTASLIKKFNIPTMWFFIFGGPGEDKKTIQETFDFIDNYVNSFDLVYLSVGLRIYPRTPLHEIAINEGIIEENESILYPQFYINRKLGKRRLQDILTQLISGRPNCLFASESTPDEEMLNKAIKKRTEEKLNEPMFRTLLRLRYEMLNVGNV